MATSISSPLVSVCIPTYNGARYLRACIDSAISQTFQDIEILIVDDCSSDETIEIVKSFKDERVRLVVNDRNLGLTRNWNEAVRQAKGEYIKFLFQDDALYPQCIEKMLQVFAAHPRLGMVFARREFVVQDDAPPDLARELLANYSDLHLKFENVREVNNGRALFAQHLQKKLYVSCVAEPPSTLISKEVFQRLGLFNTKIHQVCDIEMWLRIMFFYDIGFIDEKLLSYRIHGQAATVSNHARRSNRYDRFWLFEGLVSHPEIEQEFPEILVWRNALFNHYTQSFIRPKAGWRSIRTRAGLRQAVTDFLEVPSRVNLRKDVDSLKRKAEPIHPHL